MDYETGPDAPIHDQARAWRFGDAEFDESRQALRVAGRSCTIEGKPLALLYELLLRAGEVVTKAELMQVIWPGLHVVESSLPTAVSKLRQALGDADRTIIEAVPRVGYRLGIPVELARAAPRARLAFTLQPGEPVPHRAGWRLDRMLGRSGMSWLAREEATGLQRVFRFADTADGLLALKREAAIARILHDRLPEQPALVLGWNYQSRPYFIESSLLGPDLQAWIDDRGGLSAIPLAERLDLVAAIAGIVASVHGVGVLHGDLRPSRIVVGPQDAVEGDGLRMRLVRFRTASLDTPSPVAGSSPDTPPDTPRAWNLPPDRALELQAGGMATMAADVYALGLLLYRMVVGDWRRPLAHGWEADIVDPVLRQDIADAVAVDPLRRPGAAALATRLQTLDARRQEQARRDRQALQAARLAEQAARARTRRPWVVLAVLCLALGLGAASTGWLRAMAAGDRLRRQASLTQSVNDFLTQDLLGRGNPLRSGRPDETLMEAATHAEPAIALRLAHDPLVAASLYAAMALAFDGRNAYPAARDAYARAIAAYGAAGRPGLADATILQLRWAEMEALAAQEGSLDKARALLAAAHPRFASLGPRLREAQVWDLAARGGIAIIENDVPAARQHLADASTLAEAIPDIIDTDTRLLLRQRVAMADARLGHWNIADRQLDALERQELVLHGPDHPDVLLNQLMQARAVLAQGDFTQAVERLDRLYPRLVAIFGPTHRQTMIALITRAQALIWLERYDEAVRDEMTLYRTQAAQTGEHSYFAIVALNDAGTALCRSGHLQEGLDDSIRAHDDALVTFGGRSALAQLLSENIGLCLVLMKRYPEATARFDQLDRTVAAHADAMPDNDASIDLMRAEIAAASGDRVRARTLLELPQKVFEQPGEDPYERRWTRRLVASTAP